MLLGVDFAYCIPRIATNDRETSQNCAEGLGKVYVSSDVIDAGLIIRDADLYKHLM